MFRIGKYLIPVREQVDRLHLCNNPCMMTASKHRRTAVVDSTVQVEETTESQRDKHMISIPISIYLSIISVCYYGCTPTVLELAYLYQLHLLFETPLANEVKELHLN